MYHSITFGDKNTYDDWHLVPSSRPLFKPPTLKSKTLDIPGSNGVIDVSETLTGYPVFNNRSGTIEFIVLNDYKEWHEAYSDIMNYLHGREMKAILEDDPTYYYKGRFAVNDWASNKNYSTIAIEYSVEPYKWGVQKSVISSRFVPTSDILDSSGEAILDSSGNALSSNNTITLDQSFYGEAPVCPTIIATVTTNSPIEVTFTNKTLNISATETISKSGTYQFHNFIFYGSSCSITLLSTGSESATATIQCEKGGL